MALARFKKGETVMVISGREKGKTGKVLELLNKKERVLVEHLNMVKRHTKPNQINKQGGIISKEAPLPFSVILPFCAKCKKGVRVTVKVAKDGEKTRVCASCEETLGGKK